MYVFSVLIKFMNLLLFYYLIFFPKTCQDSIIKILDSINRIQEKKCKKMNYIRKFKRKIKIDYYRKKLIFYIILWRK